MELQVHISRDIDTLDIVIRIERERKDLVDAELCCLLLRIGQIGVGSGVGIFQPCPEGLGITAVLAGATAGVERGVAAVRAVPVMLRVNLASADGADLVPTKDRPWICWFIPMIRMRSLLLLT